MYRWMDGWTNFSVTHLGCCLYHKRKEPPLTHVSNSIINRSLPLDLSFWPTACCIRLCLLPPIGVCPPLSYLLLETGEEVKYDDGER